MDPERTTVADLLSSIAAKAPTPGGGAVAALTAALGAALGRMVLAYSEGRKSLAEHADLHARVRPALETLQSRVVELAEADAVAYARLNELWRLDEDDPRRREEFQDAVRGAIAVPQEILGAGLELLDLARDLCGASNKMLASDLAMTAVLAEAAVRCAAWNVRINTPQLADRAEATRLEHGVDEALTHAAKTCAQIEAACR
ncbi:MAG: cyclodeaminase/cyclohydrolase family protein [Planctomycetes bacterium]|nr:cyclodeaminase/cyclohydrolase family protein [Planctomycetota bacterium]